jgi:hypothetical protein
MPRKNARPEARKKRAELLLRMFDARFIKEIRYTPFDFPQNLSFCPKTGMISCVAVEDNNGVLRAVSAPQSPGSPASDE